MDKVSVVEVVHSFALGLSGGWPAAKPLCGVSCTMGGVQRLVRLGSASQRGFGELSIDASWITEKVLLPPNSRRFVWYKRVIQFIVICYSATSRKLVA